MDDGLGRAMAEAYARETAENARQLAQMLERRVVALEREVARLRALIPNP